MRNVIEIHITEKEFKAYNGRLPESEMELLIYTQKVETFIKEAIATENPIMIGWTEAKALNQAASEIKEKK